MTVYVEIDGDRCLVCFGLYSDDVSTGMEWLCAPVQDGYMRIVLIMIMLTMITVFLS